MIRYGRGGNKSKKILINFKSRAAARGVVGEHFSPIKIVGF